MTQSVCVDAECLQSKVSQYIENIFIFVKMSKLEILNEDFFFFASISLA